MRLPRDPHLPTITAPPPEDTSFVELARELRGALANVGEKMANLELYLMRLELATLAAEHKENTALEQCDDLRRRMLAVEEAQAAE